MGKRNMSSPRPRHFAPRRFGGGIFLLVVTSVIAQPMEDLGENLQATSDLGGAPNSLPRKLATFLMRPVKRSLEREGILNRATRSVEDVESIESLEEELNKKLDLLNEFQERHTRSGKSGFLMRPTREQTATFLMRPTRSDSNSFLMRPTRSDPKLMRYGRSGKSGFLTRPTRGGYPEGVPLRRLTRADQSGFLMRPTREQTAQFLMRPTRADSNTFLMRPTRRNNANFLMRPTRSGSSSSFLMRPTRSISRDHYGEEKIDIDNSGKSILRPTRDVKAASKFPGESSLNNHFLMRPTRNVKPANNDFLMRPTRMGKTH